MVVPLSPPGKYGFDTGLAVHENCSTSLLYSLENGFQRREHSCS